MSLFVKICGIVDLESARACAEAGADAVGFVFAESPREISPSRAASIADALPTDLIRVAVFRRLTERDLVRVLADFSPDLIQADHDTLEPVVEPMRLPVYRDGVDGAPPGGRFLYEGPVSGVGEQVDWARAIDMARVGEMILAGGLHPDNVGRAIDMARVGEMILAGGLHPDNVGRAIDTIRPYGVDVSSGVETEPGSKDPALIRSFVAAARAAQERLVST